MFGSPSNIKLLKSLLSDDYLVADSQDKLTYPIREGAAKILDSWGVEFKGR